MVVSARFVRFRREDAEAMVNRPRKRTDPDRSEEGLPTIGNDCSTFRMRLGGAVMGALLLAMFGCATTAPQSTMISYESSPQYTINERPERSQGSLWDDRAPLSNMFGSLKARRVGDIVTIKIVEASSASNNAATNTGRSSSISGSLENFFNLEQEYPSTHGFFNPFSSIKGGLDSTFAGSGTTTRSGKLNAYMTARISELLPNGDYKIVGSRELTVNNDKQVMVLSGIVRPQDILADNVILSTYIADAKIMYSGSGVISDRQQPGWMARILDAVWPF